MHTLPSDNGLTEIAERCVDRMAERLHLRGLTIADEHNGLALVRHQIFRRLRDPLLLSAGECRRLRELRDERLQPFVIGLARDDFSELTRYIGHHLRLHAQAMVGHAAGGRVAILHDVKAVHLLLR